MPLYRCPRPKKPRPADVAEVLRQVQNLGPVTVEAVVTAVGRNTLYVRKALQILQQRGLVCSVEDAEAEWAGTKVWMIADTTSLCGTRAEDAGQVAEMSMPAVTPGRGQLVIAISGVVAAFVSRRCTCHRPRCMVRNEAGVFLGCWVCLRCKRLIPDHEISGDERYTPIARPAAVIAIVRGEVLELPMRPLRVACACDLDDLADVRTEGGDVVGYQCRRCLGLTLAPPQTVMQREREARVR